MSFKREVISHASEAAWLEDRKKYITSTECAALFGVGAYVKTPYELHHLKAGTISADDFKANDRTRWGSRLESAIAYGMAEDLGLVVEPFKTFVVMPDLRIAASFDFKVIGLAEGYEGDQTYRDLFRQYGPGIMECKNLDSLQFKRNWIDDGEAIEATPQIEFQVAHQLLVADLEWSVLAPLVGGNTPKPVFRLRDRAIDAAIIAKATEFWQRVNAGAAPQPDFTKDADTISQVYRDNDGSSIDLSDNPRVAELCRAYKKAAAEAKAAGEAKDAAKAELLTIIKAAKSVVYDGGNISAGTNKASFRAYYRSPSEKITVTLTEIPGADIQADVPPYRNVRISEAA